MALSNEDFPEGRANSFLQLFVSTSAKHFQLKLYVPIYLRRKITTLQDYSISQNKYPQNYYHP